MDQDVATVTRSIKCFIRNQTSDPSSAVPVELRSVLEGLPATCYARVHAVLVLFVNWEGYRLDARANTAVVESPLSNLPPWARTQASNALLLSQQGQRHACSTAAIVSAVTQCRLQAELRVVLHLLGGAQRDRVVGLLGVLGRDVLVQSPQSSHSAPLTREVTRTRISDDDVDIKSLRDLVAASAPEPLALSPESSVETVSRVLERECGSSSSSSSSNNGMEIEDVFRALVSVGQRLGREHADMEECAVDWLHWAGVGLECFAAADRRMQHEIMRFVFHECCRGTDRGDEEKMELINTADCFAYGHIVQLSGAREAKDSLRLQETSIFNRLTGEDAASATQPLLPLALLFPERVVRSVLQRAFTQKGQGAFFGQVLALLRLDGVLLARVLLDVVTQWEWTDTSARLFSQFFHSLVSQIEEDEYAATLVRLCALPFAEAAANNTLHVSIAVGMVDAFAASSFRGGGEDVGTMVEWCFALGDMAGPRTGDHAGEAFDAVAGALEALASRVERCVVACGSGSDTSEFLRRTSDCVRVSWVAWPWQLQLRMLPLLQICKQAAKQIVGLRIGALEDVRLSCSPWGTEDKPTHLLRGFLAFAAVSDAAHKQGLAMLRRAQQPRTEEGGASTRQLLVVATVAVLRDATQGESRRLLEVALRDVCGTRMDDYVYVLNAVVSIFFARAQEWCAPSSLLLVVYAYLRALSALGTSQQQQQQSDMRPLLQSSVRVLLARLRACGVSAPLAAARDVIAEWHEQQLHLHEV